MVQKTVPGCGGRLDINFGDGCIQITRALYSCKDDNQLKPGQLRAVQGRCED